MGGKKKHRKSGHWKKVTPGSGGPSRLYRSDPELEMLGILDLICYRLNSILAMRLIPLCARIALNGVIREIRERFIPALREVVLKTEGLGRRQPTDTAMPLFDLIREPVHETEIIILPCAVPRRAQEFERLAA